ncbi:MAG: DUF4232 domain-containing protein [Acidimicrobiia bacterium]
MNEFCGDVTNGVLSFHPTTQWSNELQQYVTGSTATGSTPTAAACTPQSLRGDSGEVLPGFGLRLDGYVVGVRNVGKSPCSLSTTPALDGTNKAGTVVTIPYASASTVGANTITIPPGAFAGAVLNWTAHLGPNSPCRNSLSPPFTSISVNLGEGSNLAVGAGQLVTPCGGTPVASSTFTLAAR